MFEDIIVSKSLARSTGAAEIESFLFMGHGASNARAAEWTAAFIALGTAETATTIRKAHCTATIGAATIVSSLCTGATNVFRANATKLVGRWSLVLHDALTTPSGRLIAIWKLTIFISTDTRRNVTTTAVEGTCVAGNIGRTGGTHDDAFFSNALLQECRHTSTVLTQCHIEQVAIHIRATIFNENRESLRIVRFRIGQ